MDELNDWLARAQAAANAGDAQSMLILRMVRGHWPERCAPTSSEELRTIEGGC